MRRLFNILHISVLALALTGCIREEAFETEKPDVKDPNKVTINGTIQLPVNDDNIWTKALQDEPGIKKLYVAVFDDADMLYEIVEARAGTNDQPSDNFEHQGAGSNYLTNFHVTLTRVPQGVRYVEFIAVGKDMPELMRANLVDESTLASTMVVDNNTDAYFCRRRYVGITEDTDMKRLPMIRNFAKVTLDLSGLTTSVTGANVAITGFKVFNVPTDGMIAPFNANAPTTAEVEREYHGHMETITISNPDCFAKYEYLPDTDAYENLIAGFDYELPGSGEIIEIPKYTGFMSNSVEFNNFSTEYNTEGTTDATFGATFCSPSSADFLYECTYRAGDENPFIILKAEWTEGGRTENCYYKADFVYKDGSTNEYYHILRNFQYTLAVKNIAAKGSKTIYDAVHGIAMNNFEASTISQGLTNISNGESRLYISATDHLITTGRLDTLYLRNKVLDNGEWKWDTRNDTNVTDGVKTGTSDYKKGEVVGRDDDLISYCTFSKVVSGDPDAAEWEGWIRVIVTMPQPYDLRKGMVWKQPITFFNMDGLSRICMITRRQPFELTLDVQDFVAANKGQSCKVDISLPAGLTEARFPIEFYLEQEKNTMYPDPMEEPALPVATGPTIIPGASGYNYYYTRIVDWAEYKNAPEDINGIKTFASYFKTLVANSATTVWVMPRQSDGYFSILNEVEGTFTNKDSFVNTQGAASISFEYSALNVIVGEEGKNVATATSGATIEYTSADPTVATVTSSGKVKGISVGTTTISATCGATGAYYAVTTPVTYTVTVVADDKLLPELDVRWKKEPIYFFYTGAPRAEVYAKALTKSLATPTVSYRTSNASVVSITQDGGKYYLNPLSAGTATIYADGAVAASGDYVAESQTISFDVVVINAADKAPSGTVFHNETFLERGTNDFEDPEYTVIQSDYTEKWVTKPGGFTIHNQTDIWHLHPSGDYGAYASGWATGASDWSTVESWLVSREIDLTKSQSAKLTFSHAADYHRYPAQMLPYAKVMIATEGNYDSQNSWIDISPPASQYPYPDYKYVAAATDLTPYAGQKVKIAFRYISYGPGHANYDGNGCSWEVKNVKITEN